MRPEAFQPPLRVVRAHLGAHLADVRVDQRQLCLQLAGELPPPGEEEVELQQLTQSQCLIPRVVSGPVPAPRDGHQPELGDRPHHQHVDCAVAVHGGHQVLVGADAPDRLGAAGVAGEHSGGHEFLQRSAHGGAVGEVGRAGHWPAAALQVVGQRRDGGQHLG